MPYTLSTQMRNGKKMFCMTSHTSGKTYCYKTPSERGQGMQQHEMFASMKKAGVKLKKQ